MTHYLTASNWVPGNIQDQVWLMTAQCGMLQQHHLYYVASPRIHMGDGSSICHLPISKPKGTLHELIHLRSALVASSTHLSVDIKISALIIGHNKLLKYHCDEHGIYTAPSPCLSACVCDPTVTVPCRNNILLPATIHRCAHLHTSPR